MSDLIDALGTITACQPAYRKARVYAQGEASEVFASSFIRRRLSRMYGHFPINACAPVIRSRTDRLEIASIKVFTNGTENPQARSVLDEGVWNPNQMDILLPDLFVKALTYGDAYIIVWPSSNPPDSADDSSVTDTVDVFVNSPEGCRVFYEPDNNREATYAAKTWITRDKYQRVDLYYSDRLERYISIREASSKPAAVGDFRGYTDDGQPADIPNPFGEIPIFHVRTKLPYGEPEHKDAYGPQNAITKLEASHMVVVDKVAIPMRLALSRMHTTGGDLTDWDMLNGTAQNVNIDPNQRPSSVDITEGDLIKLHDTDSVVQLDPAPPTVFLEPISAHFRYISITTGTPLDQLDPTGQPESGDSRRAKLVSITKRVHYLQLCIGSAVSDAAEFGLKLLGIDNAKVVLSWAPTEQMDSLEEWQMVQAKQASGVPEREALIEAGYLPEQVDQWEQNPDPDAALEAAQKIATIAQSLGSAVQLGAINQEQSAQMIKALLGVPHG